MVVVLDSLDLSTAERKLCSEALTAAGSIVEAANLLGITRHALKRRIVKHRIPWPPADMGHLSVQTPQGQSAIEHASLAATAVSGSTNPVVAGSSGAISGTISSAGATSQMTTVASNGMATHAGNRTMVVRV